MQGAKRTRKLGKRRFCVISSASLSSMTNPRIAPPNRPDLNPTASATTIAEMCTTLLPDDLDAFSFRPPLGLGGATVFRDILRIDTSSRNLRSLGTRSAAVKLWNEISSSAAFGVNRYLSEVRLPLPVLGRFAVTGGNQVTDQWGAHPATMNPRLKGGESTTRLMVNARAEGGGQPKVHFDQIS